MTGVRNYDQQFHRMFYLSLVRFSNFQFMYRSFVHSFLPFLSLIPNNSRLCFVFTCIKHLIMSKAVKVNERLGARDNPENPRGLLKPKPKFNFYIKRNIYQQTPGESEGTRQLLLVSWIVIFRKVSKIFFNEKNSVLHSLGYL